MGKKIAKALREAERQVNNAKFVVGCGVGDCVLYERLKRIGEELWDIIDAMEG